MNIIEQPIQAVGPQPILEAIPQAIPQAIPEVVVPEVIPVPLRVDQLEKYVIVNRIVNFIVVMGPSWHWEHTHAYNLGVVTNPNVSFDGVRNGIRYFWKKYNLSKNISKNGISDAMRYDYHKYRTFLVVSNHLSLLDDMEFLKSYAILMHPYSTLINVTYDMISKAYLYVRKYKETFNLEVILGRNFCLFLDAVFANVQSQDLIELDFPSEEIFTLVFPIYFRKVRDLAFKLVSNMANHPLVWKYIISNVACRDMLTHRRKIILEPTFANVLSDQQIAYLRDNLIDQIGTSSHDWLGYQKELSGRSMLYTKSVHIFSVDDLKSAVINHDHLPNNVDTCCMCQEDLIDQKDDVICGLAGPICDCMLCAECALEMANNFVKISTDVQSYMTDAYMTDDQNVNLIDFDDQCKALNSKCLGCQRELTYEFLTVLMMVREYNEFRTKYGEPLYSNIMDTIQLLRKNTSSNYSDDIIPVISRLSKSKNSFKNFFHNMQKIFKLIELSLPENSDFAENFIDHLSDFSFIRETIYCCNLAFCIKISNNHRLWFHQCTKCNFGLLCNPNIEQKVICSGCSTSNLLVGKNKAIMKSVELEEINLILANNSNLRMCPNCCKVIERTGGAML